MQRRWFFVCTLLLGCGSAAKPAEAPKGEGSSSDSASGETAGHPEKKDAPPPKHVSKYPEPFLEPDCGDVIADGYLPDAKKIVAEVRKKNWAKLEECAHAAGEGENVHGEIRTTFRLDPDGVPRCVDAPGAGVSNKDVVNCVIAVYRTFRFPHPKGSIRVTDGIQLDVHHDEE